MSRRTKTALVALAALALVAAACAWLASRALGPPDRTRRIAVVAIAPGADVVEVDRDLCVPLASALAGALPASAWAEAREGECRVVAPVGAAELDEVTSRAREVVAAIELDADPLRVEVSGSDVERAYVVVRSEAASDVEAELAERELRPRLVRVPGVRAVELCGHEPTVEVRADPDRLAAASLSASELVGVLARGSSESPLGRVGLIDGRELRVRGALPHDLSAIVIAQRAGGPIFLRDVATVARTARARPCTASRAGEPVTALAIELLPEQATTARAAIAEALAAASLPRGTIVETLDAATDTWRARAASYEPEALARLAGALSTSEGVALVLARPDRGELEIAADRSAPIDAAIARQPGVALLSAPHAAAIVWLRGADRDALAPVAARVLGALEAAGAIAARLDGAPRPTYAFTLTADAAALGVSAPDVARALALATRGEEVGALVEGASELPIVLRLGEPIRDPSALLRLPVGAPPVPLERVATIGQTLAPDALHRRAGDPAIGLLVSARTPGTLDAIARTTSALDLPPGVTLDLTPP